MEIIPITHLSPDTAPPADQHIRGVVTLSWPYSSSTRQCAFLLAEQDFRLRNRQGQVRVRFSGPSAEAVARSRVGIGDEVLLALDGASWEADPEATRTPGKSVDGELLFRRRVKLSIVKQEGSIEVEVDAPISPVRPPRKDAEMTTPMPKAAFEPRDRPSVPRDPLPSYTYTSLAFMKRLRLSGDNFVEPAYDPFTTDASNAEQPHENRWLNFKSHFNWRPADRTPTREDEDQSEDQRLETSDSPQHGSGPSAGLPSPISQLKPSSLRMPPPPLPPLQTPSKPSSIASTLDTDVAVDRTEGPLTPHLRPLESASLPLPSPFPVQAQQKQLGLVETVGAESTVSAGGDERIGSTESSAAPKPRRADDQPESPSEIGPTKVPSNGEMFQSEYQHSEIPTQSLTPRTPAKGSGDEHASQYAIPIISTASSSHQTTPQSQKELIMAQTYRSLFGFGTAVESSLQQQSPKPTDTPPVVAAESIVVAQKKLPEQIRSASEPPTSRQVPKPVTQASEIEVIEPDSSSEEEDEGSNLHSRPVFVEETKALLPSLPDRSGPEFAPDEASTSPEIQLQTELLDLSPITDDTMATHGLMASGELDSEIATDVSTIYPAAGTSVNAPRLPPLHSSIAGPFHDNLEPVEDVLNAAPPDRFDDLIDPAPESIDVSSSQDPSLLTTHYPDPLESPTIARSGSSWDAIAPAGHDSISLITPPASSIPPAFIDLSSPAGGHETVSQDPVERTGYAILEDLEPSFAPDITERVEGNALDLQISDPNGVTEPEAVTTRSEAPDVLQTQPTTEFPSYPSLPLSPSNSQAMRDMLSQPIEPQTSSSVLPPTPQLTQDESFTQPPAQIAAEIDASQSHMELASTDDKETMEEQSAPVSKRTRARKALGPRISDIPSVISDWFSPKSSAQTADGAKEDVAELHEERKAEVKESVSTSLGYFVSLAQLDELVNPPSQQTHGSNQIDVLAVVTDHTQHPVRAKSGPRDYYTIFKVSDASLSARKSNNNVRVEVYRPWMATLPVAAVGDVILLRCFAVKSRKRQPYLLSTDASAWCVWKYAGAGGTAQQRANGEEKPVWAKRQGEATANGSSNGVVVQEEIKGPPVELGSEEREHAARLRAWWLEYHGQDDEYDDDVNDDDEEMPVKDTVVNTVHIATKL